MDAISDRIVQFIEKYLYWMSFPKIKGTDIAEMLIIAMLVYQIFKWIKRTRAWSLFKGFMLLMAFMLVAAILQFNTILWLFTRLINVGIIAVVIVFQPELRRALEQLGRSNIFAGFVLDNDKGKSIGEHMSQRTVNEVIKGTFEMAKYKTGALIVLEQDVALGEYERTGIPIDAAVSSQLIINIFEKNTPLHDGAVIIRNNRVVSATCYLPLTENPDVDKRLGTRHRAALGISEVSDSLTIVVSEETGNVSVVYGGEIYSNCEAEDVKKKIDYLQKKKIDVNKFKIWKGRMKKSEIKKAKDNNK